METVKDLILKLLDYNLNAKIEVTAHNMAQPFSIAYGEGEGCKKENCEAVYIDCDKLNRYES